MPSPTASQAVKTIKSEAVKRFRECKMYLGKMDDKELHNSLNAYKMTLSEACHAIENRAGIVISARHIQTDLERTGRLSAPMTAALRMFFREQQNVNNPQKV